MRPVRREGSASHGARVAHVARHRALQTPAECRVHQRPEYGVRGHLPFIPRGVGVPTRESRGEEPRAFCSGPRVSMAHAPLRRRPRSLPRERGGYTHRAHAQRSAHHRRGARYTQRVRGPASDAGGDHERGGGRREGRGERFGRAPREVLDGSSVRAERLGDAGEDVGSVRVARAASVAPRSPHAARRRRVVKRNGGSPRSCPS